MQLNFKQNLLEQFRQGDNLTKIIFINGAVFLALWIFEILANIIGSNFYRNIIFNLAAPCPNIAPKVWTLFTYMFCETSFISLICNMLILFWMGKIFLEQFDGKKLVATYILGGIFGILFTILCLTSTHKSGLILGTDAAVLAVTIATVTYLPNYRIYLLLFKEVSLKTIGIIIVIIEALPLLTVSKGEFNAPIIAITYCKIGGILYGFLWAYFLKKGTDISHWFTKLFNKSEHTITYKNKKRKNESYVTYEEIKKGKNTTTPKEQEEIDRILKKVAKEGYSNLTTEEKQKLFQQ